MNHYRWNMLNNVNDLVFVVNIATKEIVLKNNVFDEIMTSMQHLEGATIENMMPAPAQGGDALSLALAYLIAHDGEEYAATYLQKVQGYELEVTLRVGYFDKEKGEVYFVLQGYQSILEFIRFEKSISSIPENIITVILDDDLTVYCVNDEFSRTFGAGAGKTAFRDTYGYSLARAMAASEREQNVKRIKEGIAKDGKAELVTRLYTADGAPHYVSFVFKHVQEVLNRSIICATVQVVDENVEQFLALQDEHEVYAVAAHFSNSVLFRLNLSDMKASFFGDAVEAFQLAGMNGASAYDIIEKGLVPEDELDAFRELLADMQAGKERIVRMRMNGREGRKEWYMIEYKIIQGEDGKPEQALGKVTNVQKNQDLQEKATIDLLTSCMNKGTFEASCMNLFSEEHPTAAHAFYIIDLDNFKAVNDNLGHFFGDIVLKEVATKLKRIFRTSDYIARIGGDEFAVVMRDVQDLETVNRKAEELIREVDITYRGDNKSYRISASVGIAYYPNHADNYEDLYKRADLALYKSKNTGKNAYTVYDQNLEDGTMANTTPFDVANRAFSHFFDQQIAVDTFNLLFEADNSDEAIDMVLRHLGERFGVDRAYIFSATDDGCTAYDNTYEWCSAGVTPEIDNLQGLPFELFNTLFSQANDEGVFYCNDVSKLADADARATLEPQGVISLLHTYVKRDGLYKYALGFDDCHAKRIWNPAEISTLMYASKIIAQFLLYTEAIERAAISANEQLEVMNNLNFHAYVVDNETHKMQYCNALTQALLPEAQVGTVCYEKIRGRTSECSDCPLKLLRESGNKKVRTIIYNESLGNHYLVTASAVSRFAGRPATFVSSTDISDLVHRAEMQPTELDDYKQLTD